MLKKSLTAGLIAATAVPAVAGGPVIVDEVEVVAEKPAGSANILPWLLIAAIVVVVAQGDDCPTYGSRPRHCSTR